MATTVCQFQSGSEWITEPPEKKTCKLIRLCITSMISSLSILRAHVLRLVPVTVAILNFYVPLASSTSMSIMRHFAGFWKFQNLTKGVLSRLQPMTKLVRFKNTTQAMCQAVLLFSSQQRRRVVIVRYDWLNGFQGQSRDFDWSSGKFISTNMTYFLRCKQAGRSTCESI